MTRQTKPLTIDIGNDVYVAYCGDCGQNERARLGRYEGMTFILAPGFGPKPDTAGVYELSRRARRREQQGEPREQYSLKHAPTSVRHDDGSWHAVAVEIDQHGNTTDASKMVRPPCLVVCPNCRMHNQLPDALAIGGR